MQIAPPQESISVRTEFIAAGTTNVAKKFPPRRGRIARPSTSTLAYRLRLATLDY
jgi:hypothetical protein